MPKKGENKNNSKYLKPLILQIARPGTRYDSTRNKYKLRFLIYTGVNQEEWKHQGNKTRLKLIKT